MVSVHCKVWIEQDGRAVFGEGRARLLEAVAETTSLSAAARKLKMPYRTAWKHVNLMEKAYGKKLMQRQAGGPTGGGCQLTRDGRDLLARYLRFRRGLDRFLERRSPRVWICS